MLVPYVAKNIETAFESIDRTTFVDELVDSVSRLKVYSAVLKRSVARESCLASMYMKESLHSSRMEGTRTSLENSMGKEALKDDSDKDANEVKNYSDATRYGRDYLLRTGVFSEEMILEMHRILLGGNVHKTTELVGCYRDKQNFIQNENSKEITFVPPDARDVKRLMDNLIAFMNNPASGERNLVNAAVIHEQFETIHPFADGNGRVGRMLIPLFLFKTGEIEMPWLFLSEAIEKEKFRYYKMLNDVRMNGAWNEWIKFFLGIVERQCLKYEDNVRKIEDLYAASMDKIAKISSSRLLKQVFDCFFKRPVQNSRSIERETGLSNMTVNRILDKLTANNIVFADDKIRGNLYYFYDLMEFL
ncbi:MAG: Fic family protein [Fibrobacter sp.]|nr:Fic family protein [Fibrobacter sp.]